MMIKIVIYIKRKHDNTIDSDYSTHYTRYTQRPPGKGSATATS